MASTNGSGGKNAALAAMLRECASVVERNEFHPMLYSVLAQVHAYAGSHSTAATAVDASAAATTTTTSHRETPEAVFKDVPDLFASASGGSGLKGLGKKFKQMSADLGAGSNKGSSASSSQAAADAEGLARDAERESSAKASKEGGNASSEWCEEHFTMGCYCKHRKPTAAAKQEPLPSKPAPQQAQPQPQQATASSSSQVQNPNAPRRPCFQRPINPNSNLIANGWIEQQRRSKMRVVWKDILASLVEGRKPGEETTLWIQRQVNNPQTGKSELEALHQIPMKWLEDVTYIDLYGDHRFALKVYKATEEFQFRTVDRLSAENWILTLRSAREASVKTDKNNKRGPAPANMGLNNLDDWDSSNGKSDAPSSQQQQRQTNGSSQHEPVHNTTPSVAGDRSENNDSVRYPSQSNDDTSDTASTQSNQPSQERMSIKELRSIAHGAGYNTRGMERPDLEKIAARVAPISARYPAPVAPTPSEIAAAERQRQQADAAKAEAQWKAAQMESDRKRRELEARAQEERTRQEEARRRQEEAAAARAEQQRQEEERKRREYEENIRRQHAAAAEQKRRMEEEEQKKRVAEQQAAELKKKQEEEQRRWQQQQQWQQSQQQKQWQQPWAGGQGSPPPPPPGPPPPSSKVPPRRQSNPSSPINSKYAKAVEEKSEAAEQAAITNIKRCILINWALVPPNLNMLRPIDQLVTTIHNVFPPAFNVQPHSYFTKWKPITSEEIALGSSAVMSNSVDDEKLTKAVRKIRFFLHPDKLPKDLNAEQEFTCKMLWDVTSDSWEEYCKQKEELDWIRG